MNIHIPENTPPTKFKLIKNNFDGNFVCAQYYLTNLMTNKFKQYFCRICAYKYSDTIRLCHFGIAILFYLLLGFQPANADQDKIYTIAMDKTVLTIAKPTAIFLSLSEREIEQTPESEAGANFSYYGNQFIDVLIQRPEIEVIMTSAREVRFAGLPDKVIERIPLHTTHSA